jgi:hypothetical protein
VAPLARNPVDGVRDFRGQVARSFEERDGFRYAGRSAACTFSMSTGRIRPSALGQVFSAIEISVSV